MVFYVVKSLGLNRARVHVHCHGRRVKTFCADRLSKREMWREEMDRHSHGLSGIRRMRRFLFGIYDCTNAHCCCVVKNDNSTHVIITNAERDSSRSHVPGDMSLSAGIAAL